MKHTISFVMPVYNDGDTVEDAVRSIRDQDLPGIEIICVNDGSTDKTEVVLNALKEEGVIDTVIHFKKNKGACVARNTGAKEAKGEYLSFLPADAILYPGMARIWFNHLEENPEYDFLYGGYRFIDEDHEPVPGHEFFFEPFDPYLLETTNYIDGSFPIRTKAFWKYAKLMGQPEGLWDPKIKSLQDWDFWLSVVKNGGKGLYVQDIFFGTTLPHKGGLSDDSANNWIERINTIKKKHGIPERKMCVTSLGAGFHAKRIAYMLGADFKQMPSHKPHHYDSIYSIGFYPEFGSQQDAIFLNNIYDPKKGRTPAKKIVHFVGSDIYQLYHIPYIHLKNVWAPYFKTGIDKILCEDEFTKQELLELGIEAEVVPIPPIKLFEVRPLPKEFTVACYLPATNREFYRPTEMAQIAAALPDVKFKFFGNPAQLGKDPALTPNIEYVGYVSDMDSFISECSAIMRFPLHDGLPISVLEFLLAGRYSLQNVPVLHTLCLPNFSIEEAIKGIKQLKEDAKKGVNMVASDYWRDRLDHKKYIETIEHLAGYSPKEYWEERAHGWSQQASFTLPVSEHFNKKFRDEFEDTVKQIEPIFKKLKVKSVLDIGCGDGRWWPILKEWGVKEYTGVDISGNLIKLAQERFPHLKDEFYESSIEDFKPKKKYDLVFSFTSLEHIKGEDIKKAVKMIKNSAKKALLIEPIGFTSRFYSHSHAYEKLFNVIQKTEINSPTMNQNKTLFICDNQ